MWTRNCFIATMIMVTLWNYSAALQIKCNPSSRLYCPKGFECKRGGVCVREAGLKHQRCNPSSDAFCPPGFACKPDHKNFLEGSGTCVRDINPAARRCNNNVQVFCPRGFECKPDKEAEPDGSGTCVWHT
ncbi:hypothetical protein K7432_006104 [Basidiobolus ranarum]|uniref:Uncharacterized protein n=1 Tax=Basidiobolus ranarum TaxID=34480 RepID=A0ABR2WVI6_9FUNG